MTWTIKKPIEGFEDTHSITKDGKVWSKPRHGTIGRWMKPVLYKGYLFLKLRRHPKIKKFALHRLIAQAFIPNPLNKPCINHKNGIKTDNRIENLEWCTNLENMQHGYRTGLINNTGENNGQSKLTWKQVEEIRKNHISEGIMKRKPWDKYGISNPVYYLVLNNKRWIKEEKQNEAIV